MEENKRKFYQNFEKITDTQENIEKKRDSSQRFN